MSDPVSRRRFMRNTLSGAATVAAATVMPHEVVAQSTGMPLRKLGGTKLYVSLIGFGGGTRFWEQMPNKDAAMELVKAAIDKGINYFDTSHYYGNETGNGENDHAGEILMGECLEKDRKKIILATKSVRRDYDGILKDVEGSLKNLKTDYLDVMQFQSFGKDEEVEPLLEEKGGMKAIEKLRSEGTIKYFGITGHYGAKVLMSGLRLLKPDTICFPTNAREVNAYQKTLLRYAQSLGVGVIGMKATGQRRLIDYAKAQDLVHYAISLSVSSVLIGMDSIQTLENCVELAVSRRPMANKEREILRAKLASIDNVEGSLPYRDPFYRDGHYA